jgi:hypothetical protein
MLSIHACSSTHRFTGLVKATAYERQGSCHELCGVWGRAHALKRQWHGGDAEEGQRQPTVSVNIPDTT